MLTGQYTVLMFHLDSIDPTRIGAQVVSGIGFLGVGTIIVRDNAKVKGLTTAAGFPRVLDLQLELDFMNWQFWLRFVWLFFSCWEYRKNCSVEVMKQI